MPGMRFALPGIGADVHTQDVGAGSNALCVSMNERPAYKGLYEGSAGLGTMERTKRLVRLSAGPDLAVAGQADRECHHVGIASRERWCDQAICPCTYYNLIHRALLYQKRKKVLSPRACPTAACAKLPKAESVTAKFRFGEGAMSGSSRPIG
jgi:hypothetical protein